MGKKILSIALVAVMLFSFTSIGVGAEEAAPELTLNKTVTITVMDSYTLTDSALSPFGIDIEIDDKKVVALDGAAKDYTVTINSISAVDPATSAVVVYDEENPEEFLDVFRFENPEEKSSIGITIDFQVDFASKDVFGELGYTITINGFSTPPSLGIDLGNMVAVPTAIPSTGKFTEFPAVGDISILVSSTKMKYNDTEFVELEGTKLNVNTVVNTYDNNGNIIATTPFSTGTVTYGQLNAHMFTTTPAKNERIPAGTSEIVTFFFGQRLTSIPVVVSHAWSDGPVSITTDKYSDNKPGYHAIVCNGCGEAHDPKPHVPTYALDEFGNPILDKDGNPVQDWKSNEDATFTSNGTASCTCQECGATLTKDVLGSAQFNTAFANYHFLIVIFEYINLILRIIGASVG